MHDERDALITAARHFYQRGWMVGTAGNLSVRSARGGFWITASGRHKGELRLQDLLRVDMDGHVIERNDDSARPSAETSIHIALYRTVANAGAVYHVHSVEANIVGHWAEAGILRLPGLEMLKGLGVWEHDSNAELPVFENHLDVANIARDIECRFLDTPARIPGLLIHCHGATVWGSDPQAALHHVEILEYLFRYMVSAKSVGLGDLA